jgi:hypothetical protein
MPLKRIADDGAPEARKPRATKERPSGMTNAAWAADVERWQTKTCGGAEREKKLATKGAATTDEQARLVSMAMSMGQPRVGQFPGPWPTQGTIGSPSTYSPASSPMFHDTYVPDMLRFTPLMTHKYRGCIVVLSINKSVEPNEEQKVLTSGFDQGFTVNTSKQVFRGIW